MLMGKHELHLLTHNGVLKGDIVPKVMGETGEEGSQKAIMEKHTIPYSRRSPDIKTNGFYFLKNKKQEE